MSNSELTILYFHPYFARSPYFGATLRAGAKAFELYNHMLIPVYYDDPVGEYWHLVNHVTLWDVGVEQVAEIVGPDAFELTNYLTPRDLTRCAGGPRQVHRRHRRDGRHRQRPRAPAPGGGQVLAMPGRQRSRAVGQGCGGGQRLRATVRKPPVYPLQVQGPKSRDVLENLMGSEVAGIRYYWTARGAVDGIPVVVSRAGWSAEHGYEIYLTRPGPR